MRKILLIIGMFILITSFQIKSEQDPLLYINHVNKLELFTVDSKCGEWGGDEKNLIIYRDNFNGPLFADYTETIKNCNTGTEKVSTTKKHVKVTEQESFLILETIKELYESKLSHEVYPSHAGIFNRIMLSDSSMIITDFPSIKLKKFETLTNSIKQN